jgi:aminopeptidase-like protein
MVLALRADDKLVQDTILVVILVCHPTMQAVGINGTLLLRLLETAYHQ